MSTGGYANWARLAAVAAAAFSVVACGSDPAPAVVLPAGNVVQGPVQGATVFADRTDGGTAGVLDAEEKAFSAVTDATGNFRIPAAPTYPYQLVSIGGTDTITNQPAITMRAEGGTAGSAVTTNVVTPLTTLVALAPAAQRDALRTTIRSLGVEPNARIDQGITPAAAALVKAVTTMINQVTEVIRLSTTDDKLPTSATSAIQTQLVTSLASSLAGATANSLGSAAGIATVTKNAASAAPTTLANDSSKAGGVTITANAATVTAVAAAVETSTTSVVNAIQTASGGSLATTPASIKREDQIIVTAVTQSIANQTSGAAVASNVTSVAPANAAPTITGAASAAGVVGTAFTYTPTIADTNTSDLLNVTVSGSKALPPGLALNPSTGVISGNPTASGDGVYTLTVSDGIATASITVTIVITRVTGATGATF